LVIRENMSNSRPCMHCLQLIREVGIKKIMYSDGKMEYVKMEYSNEMESNWVSRGNASLKSYHRHMNYVLPEACKKKVKKIKKQL